MNMIEFSFQMLSRSSWNCGLSYSVKMANRSLKTPCLIKLKRRKKQYKIRKYTISTQSKNLTRKTIHRHLSNPIPKLVFASTRTQLKHTLCNRMLVHQVVNMIQIAPCLVKSARVLEMTEEHRLTLKVHLCIDLIIKIWHRSGSCRQSQQDERIRERRYVC